MSPSYDNNRSFGDLHIQHAREIIGGLDVRVSTGEEDWARNTDLITLQRDELRYAFRVRRPQYRDRYGHQFTIRVRSKSGAPTELAKIREGWGDRLLYGFGSQEGFLQQWFVGDLTVLREYLVLNPPPDAISNGDGTALCAFNLSDLPHSFILDASWPAGVPVGDIR